MSNVFEGAKLWIAVGDGICHSNVLACRLNDSAWGKVALNSLLENRITGSSLQFLYIDICKADFYYFMTCILNMSDSGLKKLSMVLADTEESSYEVRVEAIRKTWLLRKYFDEDGELLK